MVNSGVFDYINVLDKAADAAWLRNDAIANNIANADTPGYKRQDVSFETELARAIGSSRYESMDAKVADLKLGQITPSVYTDAADHSYRLDGNNVDVDVEEANLAENQIRYYTLLDSMSQEFSRIKMVLNRN